MNADEDGSANYFAENHENEEQQKQRSRDEQKAQAGIVSFLIDHHARYSPQLLHAVAYTFGGCCWLGNRGATLRTEHRLLAYGNTAGRTATCNFRFRHDAKFDASR